MTISQWGTGSGVRRPTVSPLRYPGGKTAIYQQLRAVVRANDLTDGIYVEPYAGGGGAALALLITGQVRRIVVNDLDPAIYAFWRAVVSHTAEFSERLKRIDVSVKEWAKQKEIYLQGPRDDYLALGFATFFLNRTNRSGALNGGPIGGQDQRGNYKIDARFNKTTLLERIRLIGLYSRKINVRGEDGIKVIKRYAERDDVIIYADPPYFEKAGSLYLNAFDASDHESLAACLNSYSDFRWLLTYDNVPQVGSLYADRRRDLFTLNYSAHRVTKAKEILVVSDGLEMPWTIPSMPQRSAT